ncbi:lytic transglycosylase domain-containing protein [Mumia sp. ZJ430]|uniref:aggregation-promoting factor C-terminal-like domain-containing protein n=1 Tax=Mumia sp. ZJ430 TaxID=2708083 RepID=UPI00141DCD3F|nr:lytic transglycosylase domain-containing protein [Mumia sp. ZJ430]
MSSPYTRARRKAARAPLASRLLTRARTPRARIAVTLSALATLALVGGAVAGATAAPPEAEVASVRGLEVLKGESSGETGDRAEPQTSRSGERPAPTPSAADVKKQKAAELKKQNAAKAAKAAQKRKAEKARIAKMQAKNPRKIARSMLADFGFGQRQFSCLNSLWVGESNWRWNADNPTSSAYGIPQSLPGSKMASAGKDWKANPATQIEWGLGYIKDAYGTPCSALSFKQGNGWY